MCLRSAFACKDSGRWLACRSAVLQAGIALPWCLPPSPCVRSRTVTCVSLPMGVQMFKQFAEGQQQLLGSSGPGSSSDPASCSRRSTGSPWLLRRMREARQLWQLRLVKEQQQRQEGVAAGQGASAGQAGSDGQERLRWDAWAVPLLLTGLCWHAIDTLMW